MHCQVVTDDNMEIVAANREARVLATALLILADILNGDHTNAQDILDTAIAREGGAKELYRLTLDVGYDVTKAADEGGWLS